MTLTARLRWRLQTQPNEALACELGWSQASPLTWREFLEQYPYAAPDARIPPRAA